MPQLKEMTDGDFHHDILELVHREFGPDGLTRFMRVYGNHLGDYTRDRHIWLDGITIEQIVAESQTKAA